MLSSVYESASWTSGVFVVCVLKFIKEAEKPPGCMPSVAVEIKVVDIAVEMRGQSRVLQNHGMTIFSQQFVNVHVRIHGVVSRGRVIVCVIVYTCTIFSGAQHSVFNNAICARRGLELNCQVDLAAILNS